MSLSRFLSEATGLPQISFPSVTPACAWWEEPVWALIRQQRRITGSFIIQHWDQADTFASENRREQRSWQPLPVPPSLMEPQTNSKKHWSVSSSTALINELGPKIQLGRMQAVRNVAANMAARHNLSPWRWRGDLPAIIGTRLKQKS